MCSRARDDPAGDVGGQGDPDGQNVFALTSLEDLIRRTWSDDSEDGVGCGALAGSRRKVTEDERLSADDQDLVPVSADVDEEGSRQKCREHSGREGQKGVSCDS